MLLSDYLSGPRPLASVCSSAAHEPRDVGATGNSGIASHKASIARGWGWATGRKGGGIFPWGAFVLSEFALGYPLVLYNRCVVQYDHSTMY